MVEPWRGRDGGERVDGAGGLLRWQLGVPQQHRRGAGGGDDGVLRRVLRALHGCLQAVASGEHERSEIRGRVPSERLPVRRERRGDADEPELLRARVRALGRPDRRVGARTRDDDAPVPGRQRRPDGASGLRRRRRRARGALPRRAGDDALPRRKHGVVRGRGRERHDHGRGVRRGADDACVAQARRRGFGRGGASRLFLRPRRGRSLCESRRERVARRGAERSGDAGVLETGPARDQPQRVQRDDPGRVRDQGAAFGRFRRLGESARGRRAGLRGALEPAGFAFLLRRRERADGRGAEHAVRRGGGAPGHAQRHG